MREAVAEVRERDVQRRAIAVGLVRRDQAERVAREPQPLRAVGERHDELVLATRRGAQGGRSGRGPPWRRAEEHVDDVRDGRRGAEETSKVRGRRGALVARPLPRRIRPQKPAVGADGQREAEGREHVDADA